MKNEIKFLNFLIIVMSLSCLNLLADDFYSIKVRKVSVREGSNYLSKVLGTLEYGDQVTQEKVDDNWTFLSTESLKGWVPSSVLSEKNIKFELAKTDNSEKKKSFFNNPFSKKNEIKASEVAMAGKAWEKDLPLDGIGEYKKVDEMEAIEIPIDETMAYLENLRKEDK